MSELKEGDLVLKRTATSERPVEVRSVFTSKKGQKMVAVELDSGLFRVFRERQVIRVIGGEDRVGTA